MNSRFTLAGAFGATILCGAIVAGCSGGSTAPSSPARSAAATSTLAPGTKTAAVSISIKVPSKSSSNSTKRNASYVSPGTTYVQVTTFPDNTIVGSIPCSQGLCSGTVEAPLDTTSLEVQLYSASPSNGGVLLSEATDPITITPGVANTPAPFVFNGVATSFAVSNGPVTQLVIGAPTTIPITITPQDALGYAIAPPGNVIDANQNVLISADGTTTQTMSLAPVPHITPGTLTWSTTSYTLTENASFDGGNPGSQTVFLTPTTTVAGDGPYTAQASQLAVNPEAIFLIATPGSPAPILEGFPEYVVSTSTAASQTTTSIEFGLPTPAAIAVALSVNANFNDAGSALTLSNDGCSGSYASGLGTAFPSPVPSTPPVFGATMPPSGNYNFLISATTSNGSGTCAFTVTDSNNLSAVTTLDIDDTTITVSGKGRRK